MATPSGGGSGGDGIDRGGGAEDEIDRGSGGSGHCRSNTHAEEGGFCGSSNPMAPQQGRIPTAAAMPRAWKDSSAHLGRRFTSLLGGVDLDDEGRSALYSQVNTVEDELLPHTTEKQCASEREECL